MKYGSQSTIIAVQECWKEYGLRRTTVVTPILSKTPPTSNSMSKGTCYVTKCLRVLSPTLVDAKVCIPITPIIGHNVSCGLHR